MKKYLKVGLGLFWIVTLILIFLIDIRIVQSSPDQEKLYPNESSTPAQWTIIDTTDYGALSDNDELTVIRGDADDEKHMIGLQNTAITEADTITDVQAWAKMRAQGSGGPEKARQIMRTHGTDYTSSVRGIARPPSDYGSYMMAYYDNPFTGSPWTVTEINELQIGVIVDTVGGGEYINCSEMWIIVVYTPYSPPPEGETEVLYVDSFDWQYAEWSVVGSEPWINNSDDYIYTNVDFYFQALFDFENSSLTDQIDSVYLYLEMMGSSTRDDYIGVSLWNGTEYQVFYQDPDSDSYMWYSHDYTDTFTTWESINGAQLALAYYQAGSGAENIYIRRACLNITYTEIGDSTPPSVDDIGTNTTYAGDPCLFHANWTDDTALSGYIYGTNNTESWVNETWIPWGGSPSQAWSNITKILNSNLGIRVEWEIWANDTSDNWNSTGLQYLITQKAPPPAPSPKPPGGNPPMLCPKNYTSCFKTLIGGDNGTHWPENITIYNLVENMSVCLYDWETYDLLDNVTVPIGATSVNVTIPLSYRTSTFWGKLKFFDKFQNHLLSGECDNMRGGDRFCLCEPPAVVPPPFAQIFNPLTMALSLLLIGIPISILLFIKRK